MADKADIIFFTSTIAIIGTVYSLIQTGFLNVLNDITWETYYVPQLIIMEVSVVVMGYIVWGLLNKRWSLGQAKDMGLQYMQGTQEIMDNFNKFTANREPKKIHALHIIKEASATILPAPEEVCHSLWAAASVYKVYALNIAETPVGKPLPIAGSKKPSTKGLITVTQYQRAFWAKISLILVILAAVMVYTMYFYGR